MWKLHISKVAFTVTESYISRQNSQVKNLIVYLRSVDSKPPKSIFATCEYLLCRLQNPSRKTHLQPLEAVLETPKIYICNLRKSCSIKSQSYILGVTSFGNEASNTCRRWRIVSSLDAENVATNLPLADAHQISFAANCDFLHYRNVAQICCDAPKSYIGFYI